MKVTNLLGKGLAVAVLALGVPVAAQAGSNCTAGNYTTATTDGPVKLVPMEQFKQELADKKAVAVDVNGKDYRQREGVIPGALLLTNFQKYELSELPKDKNTKLVFYCGDVRCTASDRAAEKAIGAGYTNVHLLREGIRGWKRAGNPVLTANS